MPNYKSASSIKKLFPRDFDQRMWIFKSEHKWIYNAASSDQTTPFEAARAIRRVIKNLMEINQIKRDFFAVDIRVTKIGSKSQSTLDGAVIFASSWYALRWNYAFTVEPEVEALGRKREKKFSILGKHPFQHQHHSYIRLNFIYRINLH